MDFENIDQFELWHKSLLLCKDKIEWYTKLKHVKSDLRSALSSSRLSAVLRIELRGASIAAFNVKYPDKVVSYWYKQKDRRIYQRKR